MPNAYYTVIKSNKDKNMILGLYLALIHEIRYNGTNTCGQVIPIYRDISRPSAIYSIAMYWRYTLLCFLSVSKQTKLQKYAKIKFFWKTVLPNLIEFWLIDFNPFPPVSFPFKYFIFLQLNNKTFILKLSYNFLHFPTSLDKACVAKDLDQIM